MQRLPSKASSAQPQPLQNTRSFSRYESPTSSPTTRSRSNTTQDLPPIPQQEDTNGHSADTPEALQDPPDGDIFERPDLNDPDATAVDSDAPPSFAQGYDELPIEIQSLMERFLESLALQSRPASLSIDRLAELYQDFYDHAHTHINTHISALSAKLARDQSPSPSVSSGRSTQARRKNSRPLERTNTQESQMLTVSEISDKRKARRNLELQRVAMDEAVERGVCEKVYPRIWRHISTDDEARDEKVRSRAAALSVVGVDLKELLSTALSENVNLSTDLNPPSEETQDDSSPKALLSNARESLEEMNADRYPLGKLNHLFAVHKHIVEALQQMFPSTSSADEVLPTLIYTIITSPPQSNNLISNFNFIQRFRKASKIDGEAAYCLTNLEAAITFLETVDLSSIRPGEGPEGPIRPSSRSSSPKPDTQDPLYRGLPGDTSTPVQSPSTSALKAAATPQALRSRSLSNVLAKRRPSDVANDAQQGTDTAFDNIHHALDGGFKFLFGRLREKQASSPQGSPKAANPKTLEDARKLVNPVPLASEDEVGVADSALANNAAQSIDDPLHTPDDSAIDPLSERPPSIQSVEISDTNVKQPNLVQSKASVASSTSTRPPVQPAASSFSAAESMRNLGNSLNPLKGFSGIGIVRGFGGRSSAPATPATVASTAAPPASPVTQAVTSPTETPPGAAEEKPAKAFVLDSVAPPIQRFVELRDPRELNFFDVELLLRDYQRLAGAINAARSN